MLNRPTAAQGHCVNNITVVAPNQGGLQKPARATVCDLQDVDNLTKGRDNSAKGREEREMVNRW